MRTICIAIGLLGVCPAIAEENSAQWSQSVKGLTGRLTAKDNSGHIELTVELRNSDSLPRWVVTHDPFAFDLTVRDAEGSELRPTAERADILSSPQAAILPRNCYLGLPVTLPAEPEKRWNLDITTKLWTLKPGRYRLAGKYMIPGIQKELKKKGEAYPWQGEIELPEIEIEVR